MVIKIKYHNKKCRLESHGNWIDLKAAEYVEFPKKGIFKLIPLGVSMRLPRYFQANVVPRSSTFKKFGLMQSNHYGIIDGPDDESLGYSGNSDVWMFGAVSHRKGFVKEGDRICQFEIRPTMSAPWWAKLQWLFMRKITFVEVDDLGSDSRGGFGSTGN
jgi:dUTP pyrophosphatase